MTDMPEEAPKGQLEKLSDEIKELREELAKAREGSSHGHCHPQHHCCCHQIHYYWPIQGSYTVTTSPYVTTTSSSSWNYQIPPAS